MFKYLLNVVVYLALAVWIGSIVFFGAGVASVVFQPDLLPSRTLAGVVNSAILGRLGRIEIIAGVLLVGGTLYTAAHYKRWLNWGVFLIAVAMLGATAYTNSTLYPKMDGLRVAIGNFDHIPAEKEPLKAEFDRGHKLYSNIEKGILLGGVLVLILHTVAFVRHTELHMRRYRTLESEWRKLAEEKRALRDERREESKGENAPVLHNLIEGESGGDAKKAVATGDA